MENMANTLKNIKKIEAMQSEIIGLRSKPNTKFDDDCREAYVALDTAIQKLANLCFQQAKEKGAA